MENGGLADKFGGLTTTDVKDNSLFQVMMAVEVAEATIKQQVEENNRLKAELQKKDQELEHIKVDRTIAYRHPSVDPSDEYGEGAFNLPMADAKITFLHSDPMQKSEGPAKQFHVESHSGISRNNGSLNALSHGRMITESATASISPCRYMMDGEYETHINVLGQEMVYMDEPNKSSSIWKQCLRQKISDHEQEIMQLKNHLTQYSVREAQIQNEKSILDKRIAQMRMAFDQQQQDLVDASSKSLSYRQDILEENVRLSYALQDAQQDQTIYESSLLPLLAEYSLQPQVLDAQSVISNVKVLFKHLHEKLIITEVKFKDSQYQLTTWNPDGNNSNSYAPSPQNFRGGAPTSSRNGLQLASQTTYPSPNVVNSDAPTGTDWDIGGIQDQQTCLSGPVLRRTELADTGRYSPIASRREIPKIVGSALK